MINIFSEIVMEYELRLVKNMCLTHFCFPLHSNTIQLFGLLFF